MSDYLIARQDGVGLLEVLVSMVLLSLGVLGMGMMILSAVDGNTASRENTVAANLIRQQIEYYQDADSLPAVPFVLHESNLRDGYARFTYLDDHLSDSTVPDGAHLIRVSVTWVDRQQVGHSKMFSTYLVND